MEFLIKENEQIKQRDRETKNHMIFLERDFDVLKEENRKLRKEIDIKTSDSDQMMKMLENFDQKVQNH